jgi:hypothetical protein
METYKIIPAEIAALIPCSQLIVTKENLKSFQFAIGRLEIALKL